MTTPRYPQGCSAGSKAHGEAPAAWASGARWIVNFNNGNSNDDNDNNRARVRAVRSVPVALSGECQGSDAITFRALYSAYRSARRGKKPSVNQQAFEARALDRLFDLQARLRAGTWQPGPTNCFIAAAPKAREIHAPDFADRVVHHWLVPQLEALFEPTFIHDSYANRPGKGTHAAVDRLRGFVRQVHSGQGGGFYLQLDIANYFNSIHRPTLWRLLKARMQRSGTSEAVQRATHALLRQSVQHQGVIYYGTPAERARVPKHKRLASAPTGCGLPIGNLTSQFFANVLLDQLDQFVKHTLCAKRYLRYVDDFVLVHHDRAQLDAWHVQIEAFLRDRLRLSLKAGAKLRPLTDGIDFLGYVIHPTHTRVRRRVVAHARAALAQWEARHVHDARITATPLALSALRATWSSYQGHFRHANAHRLTQSLQRRFGWVRTATRPRRFGAEALYQPITIKVSA